MSAPFQGLPHIPAMQCLMVRNQWLAWKHLNGKKPPINPHTGEIDDGLARSTWGTYEQALARVKKDNLPGVGYVVTDDDGLTAIDLDHCINTETGQLDAWTAEIIALGETYTERSPSGSGLRLFADGKVATAVHRSDLGVEVFKAGRYVTVTGAHVNGTPFEIRPAPKTLALLMKRAGVETDTSQGGQGSAKVNSADDNFWGRVNRAALSYLNKWWLDLFPKGYRTGKSYRAGLTGRGLEEDLAATPDGIKDWGVWDLGDPNQGRRSPIEVAAEHLPTSHEQAALWLCARLGIDPRSFGWIDWTKPQAERRVEPTYPDSSQPVEQGRLAVEQAIRRFLKAAGSYRTAQAEPARSSLGLDFNSNRKPTPPVFAAKISTGTGKTTIAARIIAERVKIRPTRPYLYCVPTHRFGNDIA